MREATTYGLLLASVLVCGCERVDRSAPRSETRSPSAVDAEVITTEGGVEMVLIPAGHFTMGSNQGDRDQQPAHEVKVDAFLMDRYEVTQSVYAKCDPINGSHFKGPELPTEMIGWDKAALYCNLRSEAEGLEPCYNEFGECDFRASGYRLPTEAEWEYACRAGSSSAYSFGSGVAELGRHGWFKSNSKKRTHEVGRKQPNAWGLYDMHGNVAEWCNDRYGEGYYRQSPRENPRGPTEGDKYVLRGGHWGASADACQTTFRMSEEPGFSDACFARDAIGFRCVRTAPEDLASSTAPSSTSTQFCTSGGPQKAAEPARQHGGGSCGPDESQRSAFVSLPAGWLALLAPSLVQEAPRRVGALGGKGLVGFVYSDIYLQHSTGPGHPERKERLTAINSRLRRSKLLDDLVRIEPRAAAERWLTTVHSEDHLNSIRTLCEEERGYAGSRDTPVSQHSFNVAIHAAGGAMAAVDAVMDGRVASAFCAIRPPGHHASRDTAMGFCLLNNVAIAARYVQQKYRLEKVLIVDWDVHHGNGTEAIFLKDPTVFYFSVHQYPFYPGTGSADQRGARKGLGTTLNVPLPAGSGDAEFRRAIEEDLTRVADRFKPDFVLISAGFDAHQDDLLGSMRVTADGFAHVTRAVKGIASRHCQGRLVSLLEGGYDLEGLAASVEAHLRVLKEAAGE